jgi:hypothetical protein
MSSKSPTKNTEWRWWEPPNKMQRMDPASGEYHNKNKILPKRFYLDHRKSSLKYTQVSIPVMDRVKHLHLPGTEQDKTDEFFALATALVETAKRTDK